MINIEVDLRPIAEAVGATAEFLEKFDSDENMDTLTGLMAEASGLSFNNYVDMLASGSAETLGHMYEWGELGQESGRLWRLIIAGSANSKIMTYDFKQSVKEVPAGMDQTGISGDTRRGGHVFRWKAAVVENGVQVQIRPKEGGGWLAIPTQEMAGKNTNAEGTMWFTKKTISPQPNRIAQGQFTEAWITHFATIAIEVVQRTVVDYVDDFFQHELEKMYKKLPGPVVTPIPIRTIVRIKPRKKAKSVANQTYRTYRNRTVFLLDSARAARIGNGLS